MLRLHIPPVTVKRPIQLLVLTLTLLSLTVPLGLDPAPALAAGPLPQAPVPGYVYETVYNPGFLDSGQDVTADDAGNAYVLGWSHHDETQNDINVAKLDPAGAVLWSADIMGGGLDFAFGIALNPDGDVLIAGFTDSEDFPLVDPLQDTLIGFRDAFVTKLSGADGTILYSTFLGGNYVDEAHDIAIDDSGDIYFVGLSESSDYPTVDPIQAELNSPPYQFSDVVITKLSADGQTILYSTYLGGTRDDKGASIALDDSGRIYIAGSTDSVDFPHVAPIQPANGGDGDAFIVRLSADGSAVEYGTYLGGDGSDRVTRIAVNAAGEAFVSGVTVSPNFPTTPGALQEEFIGGDCSQPPFEYRYCSDGFVARIAGDGSSWLYSTILAGSSDDEAAAIAIDANDNAYIGGYTFASDFPGAAIGGIYLTRLNASGSAVDYTQVKWSGSSNAGHGLALDGNEDIYLAGAINVPADVYVAKFSDSTPPPPPPDSLHVADIQLRVRRRRGWFVFAAGVLVQDQHGNPVEDVQVGAEITLPTGRTWIRTSYTGPKGWASTTFKAAAKVGGTWEICVTDLAKSAFVYDPAQNVETCDSVVYP